MGGDCICRDNGCVSLTFDELNCFCSDTLDEFPKYVVESPTKLECHFDIVGTSLFHILQNQLDKCNTSRASDPVKIQLQSLKDKLKAYTECYLLTKLSKKQLEQKRSREIVATTLHGLGIVVPVNAKNEIGFRELPIQDVKLRSLLNRLAEGDAKAQTSLAELMTRTSIATDECDFGTGLQLGLDLFTVGKTAEVGFVWGNDVISDLVIELV